MAQAGPAKPAFWKGTPMNGLVEEMRASCNDESDSLACMKLKLMNFLDTVFKKDNFKVFDDVEVRSNGYNVEQNARSSSDIVETLENYLQSHDVTVKLPVAGAKVTVSPRNIANDELNVKMTFEAAEERGKKSKLKKVFIPILVFILLKAMTLVPMALGVFGLKAWNALQLSFFSFVISVGLAIFQLCRKVSNYCKIGLGGVN
jgi:Protein of unknown function (DUF1676)